MGGLFFIAFHMHLVTLDTRLRQHLWFSGPIFFGEHPCSGSFLIGSPLKCEGEQELVFLIVNNLKWLSCQSPRLCQELWMYLEIFRYALGHYYCEGQYPTLCPLLYRDAFSLLYYLHWNVVHNKQWKSWGNWAELGTHFLLLIRFSEEFLSYRRDHTSSTHLFELEIFHLFLDNQIPTLLNKWKTIIP